MRLDVVSLPNVPGISKPEIAKPRLDEQNQDFSNMLMDVLKEVSTMQGDAKQMGEDFMTGRRPVEYHDLMITMERASVAMQLTMQIRNKVLDAYSEISRMQV